MTACILKTATASSAAETARFSYYVALETGWSASDAFDIGLEVYALHFDRVIDLGAGRVRTPLTRLAGAGQMQATDNEVTQ